VSLLSFLCFPVYEHDFDSVLVAVSEPDEAVEYVCRLRTIPAWDRQIECKRALSKSTLARQSAQQQQQAHMPMHSYPNQSNLAHSHAKPLSMPHAMPPAVAPVPYGHPAGHLSMSNPHVGVQPMGSMMGQPISAFPTMTTPVPMPVPAVSIVPFGARPPMPTAPLSAPLMAPEHVQALQEQQRKQEQKIQELEARLNQFRVSAQQPQPSGFVPVATSTYPIPAASNGAASGPAASWHAHGSNASVPSSSRAVSAIAAALQVATSSRHTAPSVASMSQHNANADGTHNSPGNPSNQHSDDGFDSKRDQRDHESPSGSSGSSQAAITPPSSGSIGADPFPHDTYTKMSQSFGPSMGFRRLQNSGPLVPAPFDPAKQSPINVSPHMQNMVLSYIPISPQVSHVFIAPPQVPLSYSASPLFRGRYVSSPLQTMVAAPLAQDPIMRQNTFPFQPIAPFVQTVGRRSLSSQ
jgi:hypothetical protein